ncbi:hypothetical protein [Methyloterricola oryzae]|uniref:hypothetical protein n=1 Tax=Methyloterricola oryzae TaxID=1495050 RepID=UPI0005EB1D7C|nr:hypothetical protein [Methyloterricola oryzae]
MNAKNGFRLGTLVLVLGIFGLLIWTTSSYAQTEGMERRQGARDIRQGGRDAAREAKDKCREMGGNRPECRQHKRSVKQQSRQSARERRW